jgi:hypothetical protein
MRSFAVSIILLSAVTLGTMPVPISCADGTFQSGGLLEAPQAIAEAWLRFHETDLCQEMDAVFVFNKRGVEIWCRFENEKEYQKLKDLFEPLRGSCRIDMYPTHPVDDKESRDDLNPPASLWENYELRSYLGDPFARAKERLRLDTFDNMDFPPEDEILKQRLLAYAEQILKWDLEMKRYASDLPALTRLALDPATTPVLRSGAGTIGRMHAQKLKKSLDKLDKSLKHAFPRYEEKRQTSSSRGKYHEVTKTLIDKAVQISVEAQNISWRIHRFVYPKQFAIDLQELRQPGLLDAINDLGVNVSDFQKTLAKSMH